MFAKSSDTSSFQRRFRGKPWWVTPVWAWIALAAVGCSDGPETTADKPETKPRNVILLIGDGMGFAQVEAASLYEHGQKGKLYFQSLPSSGRLRTYPAKGPNAVTDSAAAGTAFAAGRKVNNGVLSMAIPGDRSALETVLERAAAQGKRTGLVTTATITHATPAAFASHVPSRGQYDKIAMQMLTETRPNVLFGAAGAKGKDGERVVFGMMPESAEAAGYTVVRNKSQLDALIPGLEHVSGQFHQGGHMPYYFDDVSGQASVYSEAPRLSEMTLKAIELLEGTPEGFFLMVEGARIDHSGHSNDIQRNIHETLEFDRTVRSVMNWAASRRDTLVIVTSDHETGGLRIEEPIGRKGQVPKVSWASKGHTNSFVPIYAWGPGSEKVRDILENTDVYLLMLGEKIKPRKLSEIPGDQIPVLPPRQEAPAAAGAYGG